MPDPTIIPIRAAVLRTPGRPLKIERLEMEGPRDDEVLVRLVANHWHACCGAPVV